MVANLCSARDLMKIVTLDEPLFERYERFLHEFSHSLFYHSVKYKRFLEEFLGAQSLYALALDDGGEIQGALPLVAKGGKYGRVINSLAYFGSNGGIFSKAEQAFEALKAHYEDLSARAACSVYIQNPLDSALQDLARFDYTDKRIGQFTPLAKPDEILAGLDASARRNIKKAQNAGVRVAVDNSASDFLYQTHQQNISKLGGQTKTREFFARLPEFFTPTADYEIFTADLNGEPVAALLVFYYNKTVEYFTPAVVEEFRSLQALPLVIFTAMQKAASAGYEWWNWGGTWLGQDGVYRFKKKFAASQREYKYFISLANKDVLHATKDELLKEYSGFYVLPFGELKGDKNDEQQNN